jgi:hypothetical protein
MADDLDKIWHFKYRNMCKCRAYMIIQSVYTGAKYLLFVYNINRTVYVSNLG